MLCMMVLIIIYNNEASLSTVSTDTCGTRDVEVDALLGRDLNWATIEQSSTA